MQRRTPMWLSHHWPEDYDRCLPVGRRHVCRRCAVLWPAVVAACAFALAGWRWPRALDPWLLVLLPVPAVAEWCLERFGMVRHSPTRMILTTLVCAPAVGVGLARYLRHPTDVLFWGVVALYAVVCIAAVALRSRADRRGDQCESRGASPVEPAKREVEPEEGAASAQLLG